MTAANKGKNHRDIFFRGASKRIVQRSGAGEVKCEAGRIFVGGGELLDVVDDLTVVRIALQ